ncbi:hypothetical protein [Streptomyces melanogenes]|uniref:Uncharacterized protein n=1 Tax=Streptomyces melanogenes TaxID=67326 RepID=A0ABZ1XCU8_9ACTN|nr:hypothetical protein [Streptomyces melanogenes]
MSSGIQAAQIRAFAPPAAAAQSEAIRHRVRLSRLAVWAVVASGPVALTVALTSSPTSVQAAIPAKPAPVRTAAAANPAGYAQLFVSVWLCGSTGEMSSA